ncbi:MAG: hypothetical protein R3301_06440 [Saprospiraceae bacterium]|nr:hypothetical protein [Saprospiraceae bacterium]
MLYCIRQDGSESWSRIRPGLALHDLAHYVVEKAMGFRQAFFGLVDQGFEIGDFEAPRSERPEELLPVNLPLESIQAEYLVNQLQTDDATGTDSASFLSTLQQTLNEKGLPVPEGLDQHLVDLMRDQYRRLVFQWMTLSPGQVMEFSFDLP